MPLAYIIGTRLIGKGQQAGHKANVIVKHDIECHRGNIQNYITKLVQTYTQEGSFLWLDDVFITGILASHAGVRLLDIKVSEITIIS